MPLPRAIVDLEEYTESWNWLLYGPAGIGKTTLAAQLDNNLILAVEKGTSRKGTNTLARGKNVKVWPINSLADLEEAYLYLKNEDHPFKVTTIDTGTALQIQTMKEILDLAHERNPEKFDRDVAQLQDYLKMQKMFKRIVNDFNDLPINVLWIAHMMEYENGDGDIETLPAFDGKEAKMARFMCHTPDVVTYYYEKADKPVKDGKKIVTPEVLRRRMLFKNAGGKFAKTRFDVFGTFVDMTIGGKQETNFKDLAEKINNPDSTNSVASGSITATTSAEPPAEGFFITGDENQVARNAEQDNNNNQEQTKIRKFRAVTNEED